MITIEEFKKANSILNKKEYKDALKIVAKFVQEQEDEKRAKFIAKIASCEHKNTDSEVSEWHQNGQPDRWREWCTDCGKIISD